MDTDRNESTAASLGKSLAKHAVDALLSPTAFAALCCAITGFALFVLPHGLWELIQRATGWGVNEWNAIGTVTGALATAGVLFYAFVQARDSQEKLRQSSAQLELAVRHLSEQSSATASLYRIEAEKAESWRKRRASRQPRFTHSGVGITDPDSPPSHLDERGNWVVYLPSIDPRSINDPKCVGSFCISNSGSRCTAFYMALTLTGSDGVTIDPTYFDRSERVIERGGELDLLQVWPVQSVLIQRGFQVEGFRLVIGYRDISGEDQEQHLRFGPQGTMELIGGVGIDY